MSPCHHCKTRTSGPHWETQRDRTHNEPGSAERERPEDSRTLWAEAQFSLSENVFLGADVICLLECNGWNRPGFERSNANERVFIVLSTAARLMFWLQSGVAPWSLTLPHASKRVLGIVLHPQHHVRHVDALLVWTSSTRRH